MKVLFVKGLFGRTERRDSRIDIHELALQNASLSNAVNSKLVTAAILQRTETYDIPGQVLENGYELAWKSTPTAASVLGQSALEAFDSLVIKLSKQSFGEPDLRIFTRKAELFLFRSFLAFLSLVVSGKHFRIFRRDSNLVDSASSIRLSQRLSHACLSINKSILWNCEWLIISVIVYLMVLATWITVVILELIHA